MDMHPAGVPRLVGPEGWHFPHNSHLSSQFRFLPNNISNEISPPNLDALPFRSNSHPLLIHASPSSPRTPPLRLRDEHPLASSSPRSSPSPPHLLPSEPRPLFPLPNSPPAQINGPSHAISHPESIAPEVDEAELIPVTDRGNYA